MTFIFVYVCVHANMCISMNVDACEYVYVWAHISECRLEVDVFVFINCFSLYVLRQSLLLNPDLAISASLVGQFALGSPCLLLPCAGITGKWPYPSRLLVEDFFFQILVGTEVFTCLIREWNWACGADQSPIVLFLESRNITENVDKRRPCKVLRNLGWEVSSVDNWVWGL